MVLVVDHGRVLLFAHGFGKIANVTATSAHRWFYVLPDAGTSVRHSHVSRDGPGPTDADRLLPSGRTNN